MFRALEALRQRVRGNRQGAGPVAPRREPTRMELDLYGAIVGKRPGVDGDDARRPSPSPRRIPASLQSRRPWWRATPAWVLDHCRALLARIDSIAPLRGHARAAWLEVCRR